MSAFGLQLGRRNACELHSKSSVGAGAGAAAPSCAERCAPWLRCRYRVICRDLKTGAEKHLLASYLSITCGIMAKQVRPGVGPFEEFFESARALCCQQPPRVPPSPQPQPQPWMRPPTP